MFRWACAYALSRHCLRWPRWPRAQSIKLKQNSNKKKKKARLKKKMTLRFTPARWKVNFWFNDLFVIWALSQENPSSGSPTKWDSNQSPQLQRLAKNWHFACGKVRYDTFQKPNNKCADQSARMRRLVCACLVRKPPKTGFWGPLLCLLDFIYLVIVYSELLTYMFLTLLGPFELFFVNYWHLATVL